MFGVLWRSARLQVAETIAAPAAFVVAVIQPVAFIAIMHGGRFQRPGEGGAGLVAGAMVMSLWSSTLWTAGSILRREKRDGTLAILVCEPTPLLVVMAGKMLGASLCTGLMIAISGSATAAALGTGVAVSQPAYVCGLAVLSIVSAAGLGLLVSFATILSRAGARINEALMYPVFLLGGVIVPVAELPGWLRYLAWGVSLHWTVTGFSSRSWTGRSQALAMIGLLSLAYLAAGGYAARVVLDRARRKATLELT